jgi:hypothetical protein
VAGTAALVFLLAGAYVLPWYSAWCLPVLALAWRSRVAVLAAVQAALISIAYAAPLMFDATLRTYAEDLLPVVLAGALGYLVWSAWRGRLDQPVGTSAPEIEASTAERLAGSDSECRPRRIIGCTGSSVAGRMTIQGEVGVREGHRRGP